MKSHIKKFSYDVISDTSSSLRYRKNIATSVFPFRPPSAITFLVTSAHTPVKIDGSLHSVVN